MPNTQRAVDPDSPQLADAPWPKRRFSTAFSFGRGLDIKKRELVDEGVPVISYGQIHSKSNPSVRLDDSLLRFADPDLLSDKQIKKATLQRGDVVFADTSEDLNGAGNFVRCSDPSGVCAGYHTLIARPKPGFEHPYFAYQMMAPAWKQQIQRQVQGVKVFSITQRIFRQVSLLEPPLSEQDRIVRYLDRQSEAVDAAVTLLNRQRDLLAQYEQQMIAKALCQGISREHQTKDSGVDWIGRIPETWSTIRVRYLFEIVKRIDLEFSGSVLSITQRGIIPKDLDSNFGQIAESYEKYQRVEVGDFAMNSMDLLTGWVDRSQYEGVTSPDYRVFRLRPEVAADPRYFTRVLQIGYTRRIFYKYGQGVSNLGRWRLQPRVFRDMKFPLPPLNEQVAIANFIDKKSAEVDALKADIDRQVELLDTYRKQLINDVVTGKIRVSEDMA